MKKLIIAAIFLTACSQQPVQPPAQPIQQTEETEEAPVGNIVAAGDCGIYGDSKSIRTQKLDSLKNRSKFDSTGIVTVTAEELLVDTADKLNFNTSQPTALIGYISSVIISKGESCNCHSSNKAEEDFHIYVSASPLEKDKRKMIICEVTRFTKSSAPSYEEVKNLIGKKIMLMGYPLYDEEHRTSSYSSNPGNARDWRGTIWEIHPVFYIREIN